MKAAERNAEVVSAIRTSVLPEHRKELYLTISSLLGLIRSEDGCRTYRFYGEDGDQNSFILIGEWETQEAWDRHLNSDNFTVLVGSLRLLSNQADVDFKLLSQVAALATLTKATNDP